jgi:hypothetical protein
MASYSGSLCLMMLQPTMELNCISFSSAKAAQASAKEVTTATARASYLHRRKWEVISGLSGSNLMIRKGLGHRRGDETETPSCCATISSPSQTRHYSRRGKMFRRVIADRGTAATEEALIQDVTKEKEEKVEYNWEEEWYPMYLTAEMPTDSPLGLTVFDRSLVLFYDGQGKINCFEDQCPHRCKSFVLKLF